MGGEPQEQEGGRRGAVLVLLLGVLIGLGGAAFGYAEGASYLSKDPQACVNCHIMQRSFDAWQKASHHGVADCVDCHLPVESPEKYIAKAVNGWNHSKAFTLQDFPEPIRITETNERILLENCLRCHGDLVHGMAPGRGRGAAEILCTHCHRSVGHGEPLGLGGPLRPEELEVTK